MTFGEFALDAGTACGRVRFVLWRHQRRMIVLRLLLLLIDLVLLLLLLVLMLVLMLLLEWRVAERHERKRGNRR